MKAIKEHLQESLAIVRGNWQAILAGFALTVVGAITGDPIIGLSGPLVLGAVVTVKSTLIGNRDASPVVLSNRAFQGGEVKHCRAVVAIGNGDSIGSKYISFSIPSNAIPISVRQTFPDIGTTTAADVGLYRTTADGGAVVDADFFKAATVLNAGAISKSEIVNGNVITLANAEKRVWELLGLAADPGLMYDVVHTLTGAADAAGTGLLELDYVI